MLGKSQLDFMCFLPFQSPLNLVQSDVSSEGCHPGCPPTSMNRAVPVLLPSLTTVDHDIGQDQGGQGRGYSESPHVAKEVMVLYIA